MSEKTLRPAKALVGTLRLPGDKSISHRLAILAALAEGGSELVNFSPSRDCTNTLDCLARLGVAVRRDADAVRIQGVGRAGLQVPARELDAGNSGSTMRMLAGVLAGQAFESVLVGDASLSRRPMGRVIEPLTQMGARIEARAGEFAPLRICGGKLQPIRYRLPVASAQVKTAVLLAGLFAPGTTTVEEPVTTRDHTEIALRQFGAPLTRTGRVISLVGPSALAGKRFAIPCDLSAAVFFLVAALLAPESNLVLPNVGLNPTRSAVLDFLLGLGAKISVLGLQELNGELIGELHVRASGRLRGGTIAGPQVARLIDELPALAVLGTQTAQGVRIRDARELRVKESDRIGALAENLRRLGAKVEEHPDGLTVAGGQKLRGAVVDSFGDHRIGMALALAALVAEGETTICNAVCVDVSFPGFFETLAGVAE
ncbi:MAG: 3-phosphoshikimate 1-carboxyvinyltransferase [Terriglobia bacterium]